MSLGVNSDIEQQVLSVVEELKAASAIEVAWTRFTYRHTPLLCVGEVGVIMGGMEAKGLLTFKDDKYEAVKQE